MDEVFWLHDDEFNCLTKEDCAGLASYDGDNTMTLSEARVIERMRIDRDVHGNCTNKSDMDDGRVFNKANELLTRDVDSDSTDDYTLSHDAVGNLTDDDQYNAYVYDVWGRLRKVNNQAPEPVSEYRYNGLNWRISMQHDDDADGDLDSADKTYYFVYDERWRTVATFREDDSDPKEQFVYHAAGMVKRRCRDRSGLGYYTCTDERHARPPTPSPRRPAGAARARPGRAEPDRRLRDR